MPLGFGSIQVPCYLPVAFKIRNQTSSLQPDGPFSALAKVDYGRLRTTSSPQHETQIPIAHRMVEVRNGEYPYYEAGQSWAEPDFGAAVASMSYVAKNSDEARRTGLAGQSYVLREHRSERVGAIIAARLRDLRIR